MPMWVKTKRGDERNCQYYLVAKMTSAWPFLATCFSSDTQKWLGLQEDDFCYHRRPNLGIDKVGYTGLCHEQLML